MSEYGSYLERARKASAMVSRMEAAIARNPADRSLLVNLASAKKLAGRVEQEFIDIASKEQVDICRYRIVAPITDQFDVRGVTKSLESFQDAFSFIYDAKIHGGRLLANIPPERRQETNLQFGYSFSGSLGIVLVAPGQLSLFEGKFDSTLAALNQIFDVSDDDEIRGAARSLGRAAIKKIYDWAQSNFGAGFDVDLRWTTSDSKITGRYIERKDFQRVASVIGQTSDVVSDKITSLGVLVGFNSKLRNFHFVVPDGDAAFRGKLDESFSATEEWTVNRSYVATVIAETVTRFSTGEETTRYRLQSLKETDST